MAKNSFIPTQIGHTQKNGTYTSQVVIGKKVSVSFEAAGIGADSRPDELEELKIHITDTNTNTNVLSLHISITDILELKQANSNIPTEIFMKLREYAICQINDSTGEAEEKNVVFLASEPYSTN